MAESDQNEKHFRLTPEMAERIRERANAILRNAQQLEYAPSLDVPIVREIFASFRREIDALQKQLDEAQGQ